MIHNKCLKLRSDEAMFEKQGVSRGGGALLKIGAKQYFGRLMTLGWGVEI